MPQGIVGTRNMSVPQSLSRPIVKLAFFIFKGMSVPNLRIMIIRPARKLQCSLLAPAIRIALQADNISTANMQVPEFIKDGMAKISILATSLNRMRRRPPTTRYVLEDNNRKLF